MGAYSDEQGPDRLVLSGVLTLDAGRSIEATPLGALALEARTTLAGTEQVLVPLHRVTDWSRARIVRAVDPTHVALL